MICILKSGLLAIILRGISNQKWGTLKWFNAPYNWEGPWKPIKMWLQNSNFENLHLNIISYIVFYKNMCCCNYFSMFSNVGNPWISFTWKKNFWLWFCKKILLSNMALKKDVVHCGWQVENPHWFLEVFCQLHQCGLFHSCRLRGSCLYVTTTWNYV